MRFRHLAIFSDCLHYFDEQNNVVTQNPIFCKQMQALAELFETAVLYCPFGNYSTGMVATSYRSERIRFYPLPKVGGNRLADKLKLLSAIPAWYKAYRKANKEADIVYQRFPNNLNIPGAVYFRLKKKPVFATYTGTWDDYANEPSSFRFQKWFLKKYFRGPVAIYYKKDLPGEKFFKSYSPSYTDAEWHAETGFVEEKVSRLKERAPFVPVFVTAGALVKSKNQQFILDAFLQLYKEGYDFRLYIAGEGPLKECYRSFIEIHSLNDKIFLTGVLNEVQMKDLYRKADFVVQASLAEGFGKVPIEGFFFGVLPLLHEVNLASVITGNGERGFLFKADQPEQLASFIKNICRELTILSPMIENGRRYARGYTIDQWVDHYSKKLNDWFE